MNEVQDSLQLAGEVAETTENSISIWELLTSGGLVGNIIMIVLFVLFFLTLYLFFERFFSIRKASKWDNNFLDNVRDYVHNGRIDSAIELCKRTPSPESRIIEKGLQRIGRPIKEISDAIENTGKIEIFRLEKGVNLLATIAGAAPMIGFLGTVIGMILAFVQIANSEDAVNPKLLASGIYTAMGTTAAGLIVGILAYILYNSIVGKIEKTVFNLQSSAVDFLDLINKPIN